MKKTLSLVLMLALLMGLCACQPEEEEEVLRQQAQFMGPFDTVTQILAYDLEDEDFARLQKEIEDFLEEEDALYSAYDESSLLSRVNREAGKAPVEVPESFFELLKFSKEMGEASNGALNICLGPVTRLWHEALLGGGEVPPPEKDALLEAGRHTDLSKLVLDEEKRTVFFEDPEMALDLGAVAKGWAVEELAKKLEAEGCDSVLLSVGGNVRALGARADGSLWQVGIRDPQGGPGEVVALAGIENESLVTSGIYERFFTYKEKNYHHIVDPETFEPSERYLSVSVRCEDSGLADALSTALFNLDPEEGVALAEARGAAVLYVLPDGSLAMSGNWEEDVKSP